MSPEAAPPVLRVIRGDASAEEIAAVLAVVAGVSGAKAHTGPLPPSEVSTWNDHIAGRRGIRAVFAPSRHGWRTSYWPR